MAHMSEVPLRKLIKYRRSFFPYNLNIRLFSGTRFRIVIKNIRRKLIDNECLIFCYKTRWFILTLITSFYNILDLINISFENDECLYFYVFFSRGN